MWLSKQTASGRQSAAEAGAGTVSVEGSTPAVVTDGELRTVQMFSPGGYSWRPTAGQQVLVLKSGDLSDTPCIAGAAVEAPDGLEAGDVCITAGESALWLKKGGRIELTGRLFLNGREVVVSE